MLLKTNMIDSIIETYKKEEPPKSLLKRREEVIAERNHMQMEITPILNILKFPEVKEVLDGFRESNKEVYKVAKEFGVLYYYKYYSTVFVKCVI